MENMFFVTDLGEEAISYNGVIISEEGSHWIVTIDGDTQEMHRTDIRPNVILLRGTEFLLRTESVVVAWVKLYLRIDDKYIRVEGDNIYYTFKGEDYHIVVSDDSDTSVRLLSIAPNEGIIDNGIHSRHNIFTHRPGTMLHLRVTGRLHSNGTVNVNHTVAEDNVGDHVLMRIHDDNGREVLCSHEGEVYISYIEEGKEAHKITKVIDNDNGYVIMFDGGAMMMSKDTALEIDLLNILTVISERD